MCKVHKTKAYFKDSVNSDDGKHPMCNTCIEELVDNQNKKVEHYRK